MIILSLSSKSIIVFMRAKTLHLIIIFATVFLTSQCDTSSSISSQIRPPQTPPANVQVTVGSNTKAATEFSDEKPTDEGTVAGSRKDSVITNLALETVLRQPLPEIWFVFPCQNGGNISDEACVNGKMKKDIPPKVKELSEERWKNSLRFAYLDLMKKFTNTQELMDEEAAYINANRKFQSEIGKLFVEAPNGKRLISEDEVFALTDYLRKTAKETIQTAIAKLN